MKIFVDFDGVILDTDSVIDDVFNGIGDRREFVKGYDWFSLMRDDLIINNAFHYIESSTYDISLLSKISSMCEGQAKVKYLRSKNINIDINLVPVGINKCDVVNACGNVLIDDKLVNLDSWKESGGISIFFNKDGNDIDIHGDKNTNYPMICNLKCLIDGIDDYL